MKKSPQEIVRRTRGRDTGNDYLDGAAGFDANKITNVVGSAAMNVVSQDWLFLQQPAGRTNTAANDARYEGERKVA